MTREEAIEILNKVKFSFYEVSTDLIVSGKYREAYNMAIEALKQEPKLEKVFKMRDATPEERESVETYIKSISKPTGVDFWDLEQEPCEDCISRKDAIKIVENMLLGERNHKEVALEEMKALPSVNPQEPKTGHWIKYGIPRCGEQHYKCTSCEYYINFGQWGELYTKEFKYCPNCGARMKGGE